MTHFEWFSRERGGNYLTEGPGVYPSLSTCSPTSQKLQTTCSHVPQPAVNTRTPMTPSPRQACQRPHLINKPPPRSVDGEGSAQLSPGAVGPRHAMRPPWALDTSPRPREGRRPVQGSIVPCPQPGHAPALHVCSLPCVPETVPGDGCHHWLHSQRSPETHRCTALRIGVLGLAVGHPPHMLKAPGSPLHARTRGLHQGQELA